jgi:AcrR family transcriptional regulator
MLDGARQIIVRDGVHACTVDEVARRTGIAKTTIYRHVGDRDGLVLAAVDGMVRASEPPDTGSLLGDLREIMRGYLRVAESVRMRELYGWMLDRSMQDPEFALRYRRVRVQPQGPTVIALQRAIARGEIPPTIDIPLVMHLVQGPVMSIRMLDDEPVSDEQLETLLGWVLRAIGA